jgi:hypothetical protein
MHGPVIEERRLPVTIRRWGMTVNQDEPVILGCSATRHGYCQAADVEDNQRRRISKAAGKK